MAFTIDKLNTGIQLKADIDALDAEIAKLNTLESIWNDLEGNPSYESSLIFKYQQSGRDVNTVVVEADSDSASTLVTTLGNIRTFLQAQRDAKWTDFENLDQ